MGILHEKLGHLSLGKVLDVGTGDGFFIHTLCNHVKDYQEFIGIDINEKVLEATHKEFPQENIHFQIMNSEQLNFADAGFDTVCISNSIHHLANTQQVFGEMRRVLKPGGLFIINEMFCDEQNERQMTHVYLHHLRAEMDTILGNTHHPTYPKQALIRMAEDLELREISYFDYQNTGFDQEVKIEPMLRMYQEGLEKIKDHPQYGFYQERLQKLSQRTYEIGIEFATMLMILGRK